MTAVRPAPPPPSADVILMSRPVIDLAPANNEQIIVAKAGSEPFGEHHGSDRLVPVEQTAGETRHDPCFLAVGRRVCLVLCGRDHLPVVLELPYLTSPSMVRSGKPVTNQVTTAPVHTRPAQTQTDSQIALTSRNTTQHDPCRRFKRPWHG